MEPTCPRLVRLAPDETGFHELVDLTRDGGTGRQEHQGDQAHGGPSRTLVAFACSPARLM